MRGIAVFTGLALLGGAARGDPNTQAKKLFEQGRALVKTGRLDRACPLFQKSYDLEPATGTELNLADCTERLGHLADAWRLFDDVAAKAERAGETARQGIARDRANALLAKIGTVVVELPDPAASGLEVSIAGAPVPPASEIERKVDAGTIAVAVREPGHPPFETSVVVAPSKIVVVKAPSYAAPSASAPARPRTGSRRDRTRVLVAGITGGVGVAALVASGGLGLSARSLDRAQFGSGACMDPSHPVCTPAGAREVDRAGTRADVATGLGIAGAALVVTGVVLFFTAPREVMIAPTATPSSIGVSLGGVF